MYAGINAHEGMDVWKNVLIALAICYSVLAVTIGCINFLHYKVRQNRRDD